MKIKNTKTPPDSLSFVFPPLMRGGLRGSKKAFTLVELIIVITILAILATIAFISFRSYTGNARDGNKLTTLKNIEKGLDFYQLKIGNYPIPDDIYGSGYYSGTLLTQVGYIKEGISRIIQINKTPLDPLKQTEYTYGLSENKKYFQLGTALEGQTAKINFINQTYASNFTSKVIGNYQGLYKYSTGGTDHIINLPSLMFTESGAQNFEDINNPKFVINNGGNLVKPYDENNTETISVTLKKLTGTGVNLSSQPIPTNSTDWNSQSGTLKDTLGYEIDTIGQTIYGDKYYNNGSLNFDSNPVAQTLKTCPFLGETIASGGNMSVYSENNIDKFASYTCEDRKGEVTCNDGILSGDTTFLYKQGECVKGTPNICPENLNYEKDGKIFNIPQLNHSAEADPKPYVDVIENNGTYRYELTATCNDGILDGIVSLGVLQSCSTNYHTENNLTCVSNTRSCAIANGVGSQIWNGTSWGTCSVVSCNVNYTISGTTACTDQTAPTITNITSTPPSCNTIRFTINGATDSGVGLHSTPYSFDGGLSWQANNYKDYPGTSYNINVNLIKVRDNASSPNIYTYTSSITGTSSACYTYSWVTGLFGSCSASCGYGTQTRSVTCKRSDNVTDADSFCTGTKPTTSQSCYAGACINCNLNSSMTHCSCGSVSNGTSTYYLTSLSGNTWKGSTGSSTITVTCMN